MKLKLLIFTLFLFSISVLAQSLSPGDIAIIGYNSDNPDEIAFVCLTDITSGTQLNFTDNGWLSSGSFRSGEGTFSYTFSSNTLAGTVINPSVSGVAFSGSGDQVLVYQGTSSSPSFIYGFNNEGAGVWQSDATSSNTSALPTGLVNGETAVAIDEIDNAIYNGITSGTRAEILAAIGDKSNWSGHNTTRQTMPTGPFTVGGGATIPDAPVATAASEITHESFTANWDASTGATKYFLDVSDISDFSTFVTGYENLDVGNVTDYNVTGLNAEDDYHYRVRANNSEGTSGNSNTIDLTTIAAPSTEVEFANASGSVLETAGTYNISVAIANPDPGNITSVDVVLTSGESADIDGFTSETVDFPIGSSENQTVTLTITDDGSGEGNEVLEFTLQNVTGGNNASIGSQSTFSLTIIESAGGTYYDNIDPTISTFIDDLKNRIRTPYTWVPYSQFDETNITDFTSQDNGDGTNSVFCVYSNWEYVYSGTFSWIPLSREHTFPHSWMPTNPADEPVERDEYADQHHLFPTHQDNANAVRSNHPLGVVTNVQDSFGEAKFGTDDGGNTVYEPRDPHKGDAARALLYMIIRYDDIDGYDWSLDAINAASTRDPQEISTLLAWHEQDPPDQWEISRNDYVQSIQGNRNPFVDHPEYVDYIDFSSIEYVSQGLFFTEYIEGSSNNKAVEIFNNTGVTVDLGTEGYKVELYSNGSSTVSNSISLSGTLADGAVFVLSNTSAATEIANVSDQQSGSLNFNGDDAVALVKGSDLVDVIGQIGTDPGSEWGTGDISTQNNTIRRKSSIGAGDPDGSDAFDPSIEWKGYPEDTFSGLGTHAINAGPPTIANITQTPKIPDADEDTDITADVSDDESVGLVKLIYTLDGGSEQELSMSLSTGSTYESTIPNSTYSDGDLLEYWIYAEDGDGASKTSSHQKVFIGITPITKVKVNNENGELEHLNTYVRVTGVATVESGLFSTSSLDVYIQDANAGINIYKGDELPATPIVRGNNYTVEGKIAQYRGKSEIIPDDLAIDITDNGPSPLPNPVLLKTNALPDPQVLTINGFLASPETYEGMLVGIQHLVNTNNGDPWPSSGSNANVEVTDNGGTDVLTLRVDKDTQLDDNSEPAWPKDVVGIFTQFDVSAPYTWGYQIQPRDLADIQDDGALPVELTTFSVNIYEDVVSLSWETATEINNYGFEIERQTQVASSEIQDWEKIGFVRGHGNSNSPKTYSFEHDVKNISGAYKYRLKQIDIDGKYEYSQVIEVEIGIPSIFEVSQNYPNPFNPSTTIAFSIPENQQVKVEIFNLLGQVVETLVNKKLEAGKYSYVFDASKLGSGNYIYRVIAGNNVEIRKMMLLK